MDEIRETISYVGKITPEIYQAMFNRLDMIEKRIKIDENIKRLQQIQL